MAVTPETITPVVSRTELVEVAISRTGVDTVLLEYARGLVGPGAEISADVKYDINGDYDHGGELVGVRIAIKRMIEE